MRIARVFPRRTAATPIDELAFIGGPPLFAPDVDAVHISVAFTWDLPEAERLYREWNAVYPGMVRIGGPAVGTRGEEFVAGRYLRDGYTITSRGCPNRCRFCSVWRREGKGVRELPIVPGWNILDDNLLACTDGHIRAVFEMLKTQKHRAEFTGGLEAARLKPWHVEALRDLRPKQIFMAYDEPADLEPLRKAGRMLLNAGFTRASHALRCYVLCGYTGDTTDAAEVRMREAIEAGFFPMAMAWRDERGRRTPEWVKFQRRWAAPSIVGSMLRH